MHILKHRERWLTHKLQHTILGMLWSNLQTTRRMILNNDVKVVRVIEQIVTNTTTNKGLLDALHLTYFAI